MVYNYYYFHNHSSSMISNRDLWEEKNFELFIFSIISIESYILVRELERELEQVLMLPLFEKDIIFLVQRELKDFEKFPFITLILAGQCSVKYKLS